MLLSLAQAATQSAATKTDQNLFEVITAIFTRGDALAHPAHITAHLQDLPMVWGVVFVVLGLLTMLNGFRFHQAVVIVLSGLIGAFFGYFLGKQIGSPYIVAGCLSALFAAGSWPLMKYAVALNGGLVGAFIGANLWTALMVLNGDGVEKAAEHYWIGALVGLILLGLLSFIVFELSVVFYTSIVGATIAVFGSVSLLLQVWHQPVTDSISKAHSVVIPLLVLVPAIIALILQESWGKQSQQPKKSG